MANYFDVDPLFGSLEDADALIARAHELGLRVIVDVVANHTSAQHPWFQEALASEPGSAARNRYWFRDSDGLPNNWPADFGGPAWTQVPDGQWYLHLFDPEQPDLSWTNPEVREMFQGVLRFWLDRGVDGFRVDVANSLVKAEGLPDFHGDFKKIISMQAPTAEAPFYDQDGVHEIWREWRALLDSYPGEKAMVAEAWVHPPERLAMYVRPDEFHQAFNFAFLLAAWRTEDLRNAIAVPLEANGSVGAPSTWVMSNHDVVRHASRLGFVEGHDSPWLEAADGVPDTSVGLRRARAATMMMLSLPGSAYLYYGEELGLPEVIDLPAEARQDPTFARTHGEVIGRDGARVPMPWTALEPGYGFSPAEATSEPWLPQPPVYGTLAVDQQAGDGGSVLERYRHLLSVRRERQLGAGTLQFVDLGSDVLGYDIRTEAGTTRFVLNLGAIAWPIPAESTLLAGSEPTVSTSVGTDQAVWLHLPEARPGACDASMDADPDTHRGG